MNRNLSFFDGRSFVWASVQGIQELQLLRRRGGGYRRGRIRFMEDGKDSSPVFFFYSNRSNMDGLDWLATCPETCWLTLT